MDTASCSQPPRGRLAPSPTGFLHLGNAWAFLLAWLACRSAKGTLVLRIEDIDPDRSRPEYVTAVMEDLLWLGLDWDEGPMPEGDERGPCGPYTQSRRLLLYTKILERLGTAGLLYPCYCTRKELRTLAGAPHPDDRGTPYPGTCRHLSAEERTFRESQGRRACLRLNCSGPELSRPFTFDDCVLGPQRFALQACGGDFALLRSDGVPAYQLASAVDDGLMGITQVVRGEDILPSTPRQLALLDLLGLTRPDYAHVPLLCDAAGERLAKRHASLTLRSLASRGIAPASIIGLLAWKAGLQSCPRPCRPSDLLQTFSFACLPKGPVLLEADPVQQLKSLHCLPG